MTTRNLLDALADAAPPVIDRISRPGPRCVLASRVGQLVLAHFGKVAEPFPVELTLFNDAWRQWADEDFAGGAQAGEQERRRAHILTNTPHWRGQSLPSELPPTRGPWDGHLVLKVEGFLVDLDLGQMARPHKQIRVPRAVVAPLSPANSVEGTFTDRGVRTHVLYRPLDAPYADEYRTAKDWVKTSTYDPTVTTIVRHMVTALGR